VDLFKKTQKLLSRFLFVFFAEDRLLLPPNSIGEIIKQWQRLKDLDEKQPLYDRFKKYFGYVYSGFSGNAFEVSAYGGSLFEPDPILDQIQIDDLVLYTHTQKLSAYNFETDVDVNILGHIFENSLVEIENIQAISSGGEGKGQSTKRKQDGIFYTPEFITHYIVENTLGNLCRNKRDEFQIVDEEFSKVRKNRKKETIKLLEKKLGDYRTWLLQLSILDPACGSGAFLVEVLDFLTREHRAIDELRAQLFGDSLVFSDITKDVLESNIYGVDINEESIEIAKLSLWLRTAQKGRKLNSLNQNIQCGNSLVSDPKIAGDAAFPWQERFPKVFAQGGFDVVLGNPPYVRLETMKDLSEQMSKIGYKTFEKRGDLYCLFVEKGFDLLKPGGMISFIMPNKWMQAGYGKPLRAYFLQQQLQRLIDFGDLQIFPGATTYPCIFVARKATPIPEFPVSVLSKEAWQDFNSHVQNSAQTFQTSSFTEDTWVISSRQDQNLLERLKASFPTLSESIGGEAHYGIKAGLTEAFIIDKSLRNSLVDKDPFSQKIIGPVLRGRDLNRYGSPSSDTSEYIILASFGSYRYLGQDYPAIYRHLLPFEEKLRCRGQCTGSAETADKPFTGQHHWLELDNTPTPEYLGHFSKPKIMYQTFQVKPCFIYDEQGLYCNNSMWIIPTENKALLGILNSRMGWWLITKYCTQIQNGHQLIWKYFGQIPVPKEDSPKLRDSVETMLRLSKEIQDKRNVFVRYFSSQIKLEKLTNKLLEWDSLDVATFTKELQNGIKTAGLDTKLSRNEEMEWLEVFESKKTALQALIQVANETDRVIDRLVFELYGLSPEEITLVTT
jgi:hypothetical protein